MKKQFNRRVFLKGMGVAVALPFLDRFAPKQAVAAPVPGGPKRIIVMTYQMGIPGGAWRPSVAGSGFTLPYVTAPLEPLRQKCLFVSNIDNKVLREGGNSYIFGHPAKSESALTGTLTSDAFPTTNTNHVNQILSGATAMPFVGANAASLEHVIGQHLFAGQQFRSVDVGVDGNIYWGAAPGPRPSRFCFEGRDTPVGLQCNPAHVFDTYFAGIPASGDTQAQAALRALRERNKSVLDAVRESYADVARGLGTDDRRRLEEHAARIRQIEIDTGTIAQCTQPTGITAGTGQKMDVLAALQIRQLAQAMACDLAPVARIEFCNQQNPRFGIASVDNTLDGAANYDWHAMVHGDPLPGTSSDAFLRPGRSANVTTYDQRLLDGYRFFVQRFADLLTELDRFPEGTGTVLDNSLVILASDLGEGLGHGPNKMGFILAGNLSGGRTNYHMSCGTSDYYTASQFEVNQLLNSICDMAGMTAGGGGPVEFGLQGYLAQVGRPRRIDGMFA